jgi:hypothetical protein
MAKENINLIQCGDHAWAPWHIVCVHLIRNPKQDWNLIELSDDDGREVEGDYLCDKCCDYVRKKGQKAFEKLQDQMRPVCMHCCRNLKGNN